MASLPFGEELAATGTTDKHRFTSYERDSETATDYAVNRQYNQSVGRFNRVDPYQASGYLVDPQSWNRYSYVQNNPVDWVDPDGLLRSTYRLPCPSLYGTGFTSAEFGVDGLSGSPDDGIDIDPSFSGGSGVIDLDPLIGPEADALNAAFGDLIARLLAGVSDDCKTNVIDKLASRYGFDISSFVGYLNAGIGLFNGLTSNTLVAGNVMPSQPANIRYGTGATVAGVFSSKREITAITSITARVLTIFIRPGMDANNNPVVDLSNGGVNPRNLGFIFHEALHGFLGDVDPNLQDALWGNAGGASENISNYIRQHCFN
jgi:RHS repeat-associated protein